MKDTTGFLLLADLMLWHLERINATFDGLFTGAEEVQGTGDG